MPGTHKGATKRSLTTKTKSPSQKMPRSKSYVVPRQLHPWDRSKMESPQAWEAFATYRDLGLTRNLAQVATRLSKSIPLMQTWSRDHGWAARCAAFDAEQDRLWQAERTLEVRKMARRHAGIGQTLQSNVLARIKQLVDEDAVLGLSLADIPTWIRIGIEIERKAWGDGHFLEVQHSGNVELGVPEEVTDLAAEVRDILRARKEQLLQGHEDRRQRMLLEYGATDEPEVIDVEVVKEDDGGSNGAGSDKVG